MRCVNDATAVPLTQDRQCFLNRDKDGLDVDVIDLVELLGRHVAELLVAVGIPGIVHQNVEPTAKVLG